MNNNNTNNKIIIIVVVVGVKLLYDIFGENCNMFAFFPSITKIQPVVGWIGKKLWDMGW